MASELGERRMRPAGMHWLSRAARLVCLAFLATAIQPLSAEPQTTANVSAFARLYSVVRYFYPSDAASALDWDRYAVYGIRRVIGARDHDALQLILRELVAPLGEGIEVADRLPKAPQPVPSLSLVAWRYRGPAVGTVIRNAPYSSERTNRGPAWTAGAAPSLEGRAAPVTSGYVDFDLALGLKARVPLALTDIAARAESAPLAALRAELAKLPSPDGGDSLEVRLADVVVAWGVFRHFYPYWKETGVDWDSRLQHHIDTASTATTRDEHRRALQALVADTQDGHGMVADLRGPRPTWLPVRFRVVDGKLVIAATTVAKEAPVGATVLAVDGVATAERLADESRLVAGSLQWKQWEAARVLGACPPQVLHVSLSLEVEPSETRVANLACSPAPPPRERRPDPVSELAPGTWYVDLTRSTSKEVALKLDVLAKAKAIVFDVRGYPTDAGSLVLRHLLTAPEDDRWMHIANIVGPFGSVSDWRGIGWNVVPQLPQLSGHRVFLTDGRALSYAESVLGYVADHDLGVIIGAATAGANGNMVGFQVPSGLAIGFTGMRVTTHDGKTSRHVVGILPDIAVTPTIAGMRDFRDEVLERALQYVASRAK